MTNNYMTIDQHWFDDTANRQSFCIENYWMPCYDAHSRPSQGLYVFPATQHFCLAWYKPHVWDWCKANKDMAPRRIANLIPTGFLFEADHLSVEEQMRNIRPEALKHISVITFSGTRSLHIVVPIPYDIGERIASWGVDIENPAEPLKDPTTVQPVKEIYADMWRSIGEQLFFDPSVLDEACSTVGRLTRMPGATRYVLPEDSRSHIDITQPIGKQTCVFLNSACVYLDCGPHLRKAEDTQKAKQAQKSRNSLFLAIRSATSITASRDYDDELRHLKASQAKFPKDYKELALQVLVDNDCPSGAEYMSVMGCLKKRWPALAREFYSRVHEAHPSHLPQPLSYYLPEAKEEPQDETNNN